MTYYSTIQKLQRKVYNIDICLQTDTGFHYRHDQVNFVCPIHFLQFSLCHPVTAGSSLCIACY